LPSNITYTETELLEQLKEGNQAAFTAIYNRYWEQLFFMAHKRLSSAEDAKEIVQNIFFNLWQKRDRLQIENLELYLGAMARYAVYRHLANKKRMEGVLEKVSKQNKQTEIFDIDNKQFLEILVHLSNELPHNHRVVFIQYKLQDRPLAEVAEELGVSVRTAERYVDKLMVTLREFRSKLASFFLF
jgi:RNA polymerase sigma-70 factor (ECF subfamily)